MWIPEDFVDNDLFEMIRDEGGDQVGQRTPKSLYRAQIETMEQGRRRQAVFDFSFLQGVGRVASSDRDTETLVTLALRSLYF